MDKASLVSRGGADVALQVCGSTAGQVDALGFSSSSQKSIGMGRGTRFPFKGLQSPCVTSVVNLAVGTHREKKIFVKKGCIVRDCAMRPTSGLRLLSQPKIFNINILSISCCISSVSHELLHYFTVT